MSIDSDKRTVRSKRIPELAYTHVARIYTSVCGKRCCRAGCMANGHARAHHACACDALVRGRDAVSGDKQVVHPERREAAVGNGDAVGDLPPALAALNRSSLAVIELALKGYLEKDQEYIDRAAQLNLLTSALCPSPRSGRWSRGF